MSIELQVPERDPIETAVIDWCRCADLYRGGVRVHTGINLLGSNEVVAKRWATLIAAYFRGGNSHDIDSLTRYLLSQEVAQHVRANSASPIVAEGLLVMLTERNLL